MALWTDIHCHIIPGVDDGTKDMKTAMELLRMEYDDGVRRIIVTPHFRRGMFETPWEKKPEDEIADENPRNMLKTDQITISIGEEIQRIAYVESITHDKDKAASLW